VDYDLILNYLIFDCKPGQVLSINTSLFLAGEMLEVPTGDFLLHKGSERPAISVFVDEGIGPIKSLLEHAIAIDNSVTLHLLCHDRIPIGSYLGNLCRSWSDALDNFAYERLPGKMDAVGVIEAPRQCFSALEDCDLYVAGPSARIE
jgi:CDP-4-dehydro-6-deoxyglucose reductase